MSRCRDFADLAAAYSEDALGQRNMVTNGNMAISQRSGTTAYTTINSYTLDRWKIEHNALDNLAFEVTQSTTVPDAFHGGYSLKYQTKTVESAIASDEFLALVQFFEGLNLQRLCYGTSSAKTMTLSFWIRSSLTGTFGVSLYQYDGGDVIGGTYTISSADTWEYKTVSFVGNTGDAIANDNTSGFKVQWCLGMGSNYTGTANTTWTSYTDAKRWNGHTQSALLTTDESTWHITGVQLELGEVATEFEHEAYGDTLRKCQRYYYVAAEGNDEPLGSGVAESATSSSWTMPFPVTMRASPSIEDVEATNYYISYGGGATDTFDGIKTADMSAKAAYCYNDAGLNAGGNTAGRGVVVSTNNASSKVAFDAELQELLWILGTD